MTRKERADRLRPWVQRAVDESSLRIVGEQMKLPHTTVGSFCRGVVPQAETLTAMESWAKQQGINLPESVPDETAHEEAGGAPGELAQRQMEHILTMEAEPGTRLLFLREQARVLRAAAAEGEARVAEHQARAAALRAQAALYDAQSTALEVESLTGLSADALAALAAAGHRRAVAQPETPRRAAG